MSTPVCLYYALVTDTTHRLFHHVWRLRVRTVASAVTPYRGATHDRSDHNRKFYEKGWGNREVITYMYDMIDKPKVFLESNRPRQVRPALSPRIHLHAYTRGMHTRPSTETPSLA